MKKNILIIIITLLTFVSCNMNLFTDDGYLDYQSDTKLEENFNAVKFTENSVLDLRASTNDLSSIYLEWDDQKFATQYIIERASKDPVLKGERLVYPDTSINEDEWKVINLVNETYYNDTDVVGNKVYYYRVTSYNDDSLVKGKQSDVVVSNILSNVVGLSASKSVDPINIYLNWQPVLGSTFYRLEVTSSDTKTILLNNTTSYIFDTNGSNQGGVYKFKIYSVSEQNITSSDSNTVIGYTSVEGSPENPKDFKASTKKEFINLEWKFTKGKKDIFYTIDRTNLTTNEVEEGVNGIKDYDILDNNKLNELRNIKIVNDTVTFIDKTCKTGFKYKYSIYCYSVKDGKKLYSSESTAEGSRLSIPSEINLSYENGKYKLSSNDPVGFEEFEDGFTYNITDIKYYETVTKAPLFNDKSQELKVGVDKENIKITKANKKLNAEFDYYPTSFKITIKKGAISSSKDFNYSSKNITKIKATRNKFIVNKDANEKGVYPVKLEWEKNKEVLKYFIYRTIKGENNYIFIGETFDNTYYDEDVKIGVKYSYCVKSLSKTNKISENSNIEIGYGAITDLMYQKIVDHYAVHIWGYDSKRPEIKSYVDAGGTGSLGSATIYGNVSGSLAYNAKVQGFGGYITFTYNNYSDFSWLVVNGEYNITADSGSNGNFGGKITTSGMYEGSLDFTGIPVVKGIGKGYITITQLNNGKGSVKLPMIGNYKLPEYANFSVDGVTL